MLMILFFGALGFELLNYFYYKKVSNFINNKKTHSCTNETINTGWLENYWLHELTKTELSQWVLNTINYHYKNKEKGIDYKKASFEEIDRRKMIKWTGYHLYFKAFKELTELEKKNTERILLLMEAKLNFNFSDINIRDRNLDYKLDFSKFGKNRMVISYKPNILYVALNILKNTTYLILNMLGFKRYQTEKSKITYFYYKDDKHKETTMFLHGLGFGITPYLTSILKLKHTCNVILIIIPNVSNMEFPNIIEELSHDILFPSSKVWRSAIKGILEYHQLQEINIIAHSFGTIILGLLLKDSVLRSKLKRKIFVDPVCFIDECYKIYQYINLPNNCNLINKVFNKIIYEDIYVRYVTERFMFGPEYWINSYDFLSSNHNLVILSFNDQLIPSLTLYKRMVKENIPCLLVDRANHADIFLTNEYQFVVEYLLSTLK